MKVCDRLWAAILDLKCQCASSDEPLNGVAWDGDRFEIVSEPADAVDSDADMVISASRFPDHGGQESTLVDGRLWLYARNSAMLTQIDAIKLYVPLCLALADCPKRPFVIVHMAQSVDGRVCTTAGNSKWIGNEENLVHAHRVRALVDGVLVGGNTARKDLPRLSVRNVSGPNPARILFSDSFDRVEQLPSVEGARTIVLRRGRPHGKSKSDEFAETIYYEGNDASADVCGVLCQLRDSGIRSLLIEGGPMTFRSFFEAGAVDWLQVHIAPLLFGSGKSLVSLPEIMNVDDATIIRKPFYTKMDDAMMLTGSL